MTWDSVLENCSAIYYNIMSTELCGICPSTVTQNLVVCTNLTQNGVCNISVETMGCNANDGRESTSVISLMISIEIGLSTTLSSEPSGIG